MDSNALNLRMLDLINAERLRRKVLPLSLHKNLISAAQAHSDDMSKNHYFNHISPNGNDWANRAAIAGYPKADLTTIGEDIGCGQASPEILFKDFCQSPGHYSPIVLPRNQHCGLGASQGSNGLIYWTLAFGYIPVESQPTPKPKVNLFGWLKKLFGGI